MTRRPDSPCAGGCGRLLWRSRGSLEHPTCRDCRRRIAATRHPRTCAVCGATFHVPKPSTPTVTCSHDCAQLLAVARNPRLHRGTTGGTP